MKKLKMALGVSFTFEEGCTKYLINCRQGNLREGTINHYRQSYLYFYKFFAPKMHIEDIDGQNYKDYVLHLKSSLDNDVGVLFIAQEAFKAHGNVFLKVSVEELIVVKMVYTVREKGAAVVAGFDIGDDKRSALRIKICSGKLGDLLLDSPRIFCKASSLVKTLVGGSGVCCPVERIDTESSCAIGDHN